ncbi:MAG: MarR family transcriptional regulator [Geobacteraceae bacterium]|nr:MarR family transcriptional regulator [Geobacteraceae bacterium]
MENNPVISESYRVNGQDLDRGKLVAETIDDLRRIFQAISDFSRHAERATGLTGSQLWAVKVIFESSSIRVSDLSRRMYLHPATVVGIIDRLELQGLVQRIRSTKDRRVVDVELTAKGNKLVEIAPDVAQSLLVRGLEEMTDECLTSVQEGMSSFAEILGVKGAAPRLILSNEVNIA